jgi:hypothetical protein
MNELTRFLLRQVWIETRGTPDTKSFARFERAVQDRYGSHVRATVGTRMIERAARLARQLWTSPDCFDPDDPCDNCSILLADTLSCHYFCWWLDRHPEWQLDPFTHQDLLALGGCTSDAQLALW